MKYRAVPKGSVNQTIKTALLESLQLVNAFLAEPENKAAVIGVPALLIEIERMNNGRFDIEIKQADI